MQYRNVHALNIDWIKSIDLKRCTQIYRATVRGFNITLPFKITNGVIILLHSPTEKKFNMQNSLWFINLLAKIDICVVPKVLTNVNLDNFPMNKSTIIMCSLKRMYFQTQYIYLDIYLDIYTFQTQYISNIYT